MGDLTGDQMWTVADLAERYSNGNIRTTINQNMVIRWIPEGRLEEFYDELVTHSLGDPGAELVEDIIACPGHRHLRSGNYLLQGDGQGVG